MKDLNKEHIFDHPWHTVVHGALRKYPNPENQNVVGMDVINQRVRNGILQTERMLRSKFSIPGWASQMFGFSGCQYSLEYSEIDPQRQVMMLNTRNLSCANLMRVDERLVYTPHPTDPNKTVLKQGTAVTVNVPALKSYCEKCFLSVYESHAQRGPKGLEWVIAELTEQTGSAQLS